MADLNLPTFNAKVLVEDGKKKIFDILRKKYVALTPEERVRQCFVNYITTYKGYPIGLLANEMAISLNGTTKRCDSVLFNRNGKPLMIIEYKAPSVKISKKVFDQIVRYNIVLRVKYLIVSNGLEHYCCKVDYQKNKCQFLPEIPDYSDIESL